MPDNFVFKHQTDTSKPGLPVPDLTFLNSYTMDFRTPGINFKIFPIKFAIFKDFRELLTKFLKSNT